jgi:hypothetical protein
LGASVAGLADRGESEPQAARPGMTARVARPVRTERRVGFIGFLIL